MARNKYPEETVQKILDAALKVFMEKGYEQTTILDIVKNMGGMTRGAFYHHFKSKEEVFDALTGRLFHEDNPFELVKQQTGLNGLEKLKYIILNWRNDDDSRKITLFSLEALKSPTFLKALIDDNNNILSPLFQEVIEEGARDGSIMTKNPRQLAQLLTILTNFWMVPAICPGSEEELMDRFYYIKEILDKMGLPLLDDEVVAHAIETAL